LFSMSKANDCKIIPVGKRRDGGTRFWCLAHHADATAKYGKRARECRYAHVPPILAGETLRLDPTKYQGGIAAWGAVPPIYDTTRLPIDRGIHVHARSQKNSEKAVDHTFRRVDMHLAGHSITLSELDAIYYMVSSVFGYQVKYVECSYCSFAHLDKDWFSVNMHRRHLCAGCGKTFSDIEQGVGNPIAKIRDWIPKPRRSKPSKRSLRISQQDFAGGIQIWGSNPAIVWTSAVAEEEGIHVHAFKAESETPNVDDTFGSVEIDGVTLDPTAVRLLMAQSALPHIEGRVISLNCDKCGADQLDRGSASFTPKGSHECDSCGAIIRVRGRIRNVVSNPMVGVLELLSAGAPREPQRHDLGLLPETI